MNEKEETIKFSELANFFPKQKEALEASKKFKFTLYGGSVGAGKSRWLRWASIYWLITLYAKNNIEGIRAGLFCEDYPSLNDRHLSKIKYEFPDWLGTFNEARHEFTLSPEYGSGVLAFRNLDDTSKYLSVEFAVIAIDEVNRNPKPKFDMLRSRLRWPGIKTTKFIAACNPLGEAWVKNMWVKRLFPQDEQEQYEFVYIPALPTDNPYLPSEYFKSLESLPEVQRKAYLDGNWDAFDDSRDIDGWLRLLTDGEFRNLTVNSDSHVGYKILGVDPAAGGDNSAIVMKSFGLQEILFNKKLNDVMSLAAEVSDCYRQNQCAMIVIDKTGVGQGVYDRIRQMELPVIGVSFGEKAEGDMFANLKAELHWKEREWLLKGGRLLSDPGWNEFETVKYDNKNGSIKIQPKEELFRQGLSSPNCVDAAVLTMCVKESSIKNNNIIKMRGGKFHDKMLDVWQGK